MLKNAGKKTTATNQFQNKTTTQLLNDVEELMSMGTDMDTELLEQYLAELQSRAPVMEDYDPTSQWEKLSHDYPLIVNNAFPNATLDVDNTKKSSAKKVGLRALRIFEVVVAAMLILVITANALGVNPIQAVITWADGIIQIYSNPSGIMELPEEDVSEYRSLEDALSANGIDPQTVPKWVPKDFVLSSISIKSSAELTKYSAVYSSERGELLIRVSEVKNSLWSSTVERDDDGVIYIHNGVEYFIATNYSLTNAGWKIGSCSYSITGDVSESEVENMINSISYTIP